MQKLTDHEATLTLRLLSTTNETLRPEIAEPLARAMGIAVEALHDLFEKVKGEPPVRAPMSLDFAIAPDAVSVAPAGMGYR